MTDFGFDPLPPWLRFRPPPEDWPGFRVRSLDGAPDGPGDPLEAEPEQATTTMARTAMAAARACCDMAPRRSRGRNGSTRRFEAFCPLDGARTFTAMSSGR